VYLKECFLTLCVIMLLLLLLQEAELRGKCEDAAQRMWMGRWAAAAAAAKEARLQRQREDAALAAADVSVGRARQNKRRLGVLSAAAAAELELLQLIPGERQVGAAAWWRGVAACTAWELTDCCTMWLTLTRAEHMSGTVLVAVIPRSCYSWLPSPNCSHKHALTRGCFPACLLVAAPGEALPQ
jgi:hypothetical protein